jgi:predicted transcriptional regulator
LATAQSDGRPRSSKRELVLEEPLMVKVEPALKRRLKIEAARMGTDMSKMVRQAIMEHLDRIERRRTSRTNASERKDEAAAA